MYMQNQDQALYLASEENIPLASRSWLWKKKRNSVFPEAESQNKAEVWVQTVIPSSSQVTEDSLRSDVEPKSQATITSSVPLPGSVTAYLDEMQVHPSCAIKSIMIDEETGQVEIGQGESWLNKLRINRNKLAFLKCLIGWKGNKTAVEKGILTQIELHCHAEQILRYTTTTEHGYLPQCKFSFFLSSTFHELPILVKLYYVLCRMSD
ncbi:uncharacterized protein LOC128839325 [Malaclemys terrapin pileata]|uniref:uncharacterized protein LOC128839325 n=1 Tax=Malaclemys terrapin pileata TaxID=2991368 RepID=UPI0023A8AD4E|nr:uncharacterized protein LOC128839325 [Malaclemys terrapin pileata]